MCVCISPALLILIMPSLCFFFKSYYNKEVGYITTKKDSSIKSAIESTQLKGLFDTETQTVCLQFSTWGKKISNQDSG